MRLDSNSVDKLDYEHEGMKLVSLVFNITLFTDSSFTKENKRLMNLYDKYFEVCSKDNFFYYATTNMKKHRGITKRTFEILKTWTKPGAPLREDIDLDLKDGNLYQDAPKYRFEVSAREMGSIGYEKKNANVVSMSFPPEFLISGKRLAFVEEICNIFPFQSGLAGYCFQCSRYDKQQSETYAYNQAMRYKSVDICRLPHDGIAVGHDGIKGVNWITILSHEFISKLGGYDEIRKIISNNVKTIEVKYGYILITGDAPILGDTNRKDDLTVLKSVYNVVEPLITKSAKRSPSFNLLDEYVEKTESWFMRLSRL